MSVLSAESTNSDVLLLEHAVDPEWLAVTGAWYVVSPPVPVDDQLSPKFSYDRLVGEYEVNMAHPQAAALARMILRGAVDHDKVLSSELNGLVYEGLISADERAHLAQRRQVGGRLFGLVNDLSLTEESVVGVGASGPRPLFAALDAFTRLPQLSIAETELAYTARAEFVDFVHATAVPEGAL